MGDDSRSRHPGVPIPPTTELDPDVKVYDEIRRPKELYFFGRDLAQIPCFRNSFLYGITSGIGAGIVYFAFTSRITSATKFGAYTYAGITLGYFCYCRYHYAKTKFEYQQLKFALAKNAELEGTPKGLETFIKNSKNDDES